MYKSVFIFAVWLVAFSSSFPANERIDLTDEDFDPFGGHEAIVDTGYFNSYSSLDGFYKRLRDIITSFRETVAGDSTSFIQPFGDLGEGNTTSYTKVIGGHKVEVNETEYKKDTDYGTSHVKVSFINVRPLHPDTVESSGTTEADTEPINKPSPSNKDRESLEDSVENEIPNVDEVGKSNLPQRLQQA